MLADLAEIYSDERTDKIPSARICELLAAMEGRPWAEWGRQRKPISPNQLANQLRRFGVSPKKIRFGEHSLQGYSREEFDEPFARYLPDVPYSTWNNGTRPGKTHVSEVEQPEGMFHPENGPYTGECSGVPSCTDGGPDLDAINSELATAAAATAQCTEPPSDRDPDLVL